MTMTFRNGLFLFAFFAAVFSVSAQTKATKKNKKVKKTPTAAASSTQKTVEAPAEIPAKRNERPADEAASPGDGKANSRNGSKATAVIVPVYFYEFTRPGFTYSRIVIEHDEAGRGKISFLKDSFDEMLTDPISLSMVTLGKINDALAALNYFDSTENYQHSRDFSNLGNVSITVKKGGRERTVKFNWTENKNAKILLDEYRRIGNEYTWRFEITTARENFPLQTPGLMDTLDSYLKRSEISDPPHLLPFLTQLSTDERLPLMSRNRAAKLIKQIEKKKEDKK